MPVLWGSFGGYSVYVSPSGRVQEGSPESGQSGPGSTISVELVPTAPIGATFFWRVEPNLLGPIHPGDFWDQTSPKGLNGGPADQMPSGFGLTASLTLTANSTVDPDRFFQVSFYKNQADASTSGGPVVVSFPISIVDDDIFYFTYWGSNGFAGQQASTYSGPVLWLRFQYIGNDNNETVGGTGQNDFMNLLGGNDAADGGDGRDVIDGGGGSNFLRGGAGQDVFFLDGRGGLTTWSTIADWTAGEQLSVWGWRPGISRLTWVEDSGAVGFAGVTMNADLDGDGVIDTSVTWSGVTRDQLPAPIAFDGLLWFT